MIRKTILLTGATDGIGFVAAERLLEQGHKVLLHGRSATKLESARQHFSGLPNSSAIETYQADLSSLAQTRELAKAVKQQHQQIDVLINNAGVYKTPVTTTGYGVDVRVIVNTIAPYLLTLDLLPVMSTGGRVLNLSSAAQEPVDFKEFFSAPTMPDWDAYAQSKLAIIMWTRHLVLTNSNLPTMIALNPGSLLASKMVKEGFGVAGKDLSIGANIIEQLALADAHQSDSGQYFDNDIGAFSSPHEAALNDGDCANLVKLMDEFLAKHQS